MRSLSADIWREVALSLTLAVCIPTLAFPVLVGHAVNDSPASDNGQIHELVRVLNGAYENSLLHDSSRTDLEASDVLLETASIRFSAHALKEIKDGSCRSGAQAGANPCALADPFLALGDWAATLSYAAQRLESLARSTTATDRPDNSRSIVIERVESMEHLYRMAFAVSEIYLDPSQSRSYLDAAQEQLRLASKHIEAERNLCACDGSTYTRQLLELAELDDEMNDMRYVALP